MSIGYAAGMFIRGLPLITAIVPFLGINIAYWIGVEHGNLPSCNPYLDGCTSISATGRYPPGDRLFRAVMLPHSAWLVLTWYFAAHWLRSVKPGTRADKTILISGVVGAIALIIYVSYLASNDPFYEIMRRYGIYFYFLGTAIAQIGPDPVVTAFPTATRHVLGHRHAIWSRLVEFRTESRFVAAQ